MQVKQQWILDTIAAEITVAIAFPEKLSWTAARAAALETLALTVDFPRCFHVEISRDRDECHLVGIDCITDGKEKRTFFVIVWHRISSCEVNLCVSQEEIWEKLHHRACKASSSTLNLL